MYISVVLFGCLVTSLCGEVSGRRRYPSVVNDGGRDIHYFTTSGWLGLREGVVVARGMPLALTCDFRDKVRRVMGPDGVMRSEVLTNTTSVNITFPSGAGQEVRHISPLVNTFRDTWRSYRPEDTVFFPAVTKYTQLQCRAAYSEEGKTHVSTIQISVTPVDGVSVWRSSEDMKEVSEVECKAYDLLVSRLSNYSREMYDVVSLMMAGDSVLTTVPRTAVMLPFSGSALLRTGALNGTKERLNSAPEAAKSNITCVVYHVHRPDWGAFVRWYVPQSKRVPWWIVGLTSVSLAVLLMMMITAAAHSRKQQQPASRLYGYL